MVIMNVNSVTQTAQLYPMNFNAIEPDRPIHVPEPEEKLISEVEAIHTEIKIEMKLQDLGNSLAHDAANRLLEEMDKAMAEETGIGQAVDVRG